MMTPPLRKLVFATHLSVSIGWIGAVCAFLTLSVAGLGSEGEAVVRGAYLSMDLISRFVIIPMSLATLGTGLLLGLGTRWGLFRTYWVLASLVLTVIAIVILLAHQFSAMATAVRLVSDASAPAAPWAELRAPGFVLLRASGLGLLVLLFVAAISVYKPWGLTPYGQRSRQPVGETRDAKAGKSRWALGIALAILGASVAAFIAWHLATMGGHARHGH